MPQIFHMYHMPQIPHLWAYGLVPACNESLPIDKIAFEVRFWVWVIGMFLSVLTVGARILQAHSSPVPKKQILNGCLEENRK